MSNIMAQGEPKSREIYAVITRADGTVEDLGMVSYWHRNPLRVWAWKIGQVFKKNKKG